MKGVHSVIAKVSLAPIECEGSIETCTCHCKRRSAYVELMECIYCGNIEEQNPLTSCPMDRPVDMVCSFPGCDRVLQENNHTGRCRRHWYKQRKGEDDY